MNLLIIFGAIIWGTFLYKLVNSTSYPDGIKAVIIILITVVAIFILKVIDEDLDHKEEE